MSIVNACGLNIFVESTVVTEGARWASVTPPGLWLGALLQGNLHVRQSFSRERTIAKGDTTIFASDRLVETSHHILATGTMTAVFLQIDSEEGPSLLGREAKDLLRSIASTDGTCPAPATSIAWQMATCTLSGAARDLYMTGKALEWVAHVLRIDGDPRSAQSGRWSKSDIERFHAARAILIENLANPPSIPELAIQVGTNARKLNVGFADLFGQSAYAFVKTRRLEEAKLMLEAGEASVAQVAYRLGYQPAHFSTEFKRRFGVPPRDLLSRRNVILD